MKVIGISTVNWKNRKKEILASYELHDSDDISTERLLQMVSDDCGVDVSTVIRALKENAHE